MDGAAALVGGGTDRVVLRASAATRIDPIVDLRAN
jgi:hypothetical protein